MATVNFTINTQSVSFPGGTMVASYHVELRGPHPQAMDVPYPTKTGSFLDVPEGVGYTVHAVMADPAGAALGSEAVSNPFDVVAPSEMLEQPLTVDVVVM